LASFNQLSVLNTKGPSFGGFIGYNYQIDDIVAGFEFNFNGSSVEAGSSQSNSRTYNVCLGSPGSTNCAAPPVPLTFTVTNGAAAKINDYGTVRMRLGWVYGSFLPYVLGGVAVSQIDTSRLANVTYAFTPPGGLNQSDISHGKWTFGFDAGLGIDYVVTRNIFLRGEAKYLQLSSVNNININTVSTRLGLGLKY
jgi:opacity protein-like surface antigen